MKTFSNLASIDLLGLKIYYQSCSMRGRRMQRQFEMRQAGTKEQDHSPSTQESYSPHNTPSQAYFNKEKSELCRKFMQRGYCPYQKKCKFAHGSHELKRNNTANSKYKTKECGAFFNEGACRFGERCNFLHSRKEPSLCQNALFLKSQYRQVIYWAKNASTIVKRA